MKPFEQLMQTQRPWLTDGGLETWLFFQRGFSAPEFAAITLARDEAARGALNEYFDAFLSHAQAGRTGFVLDTITWRGCPIWAEKLGMSEDNLLELSREAVRFASSIRDRWQDRVGPIVLNGVVGPVGDGYSPDSTPSSDESQALHAPQINALAQSGVDMISAITMTNIAEATGVARAAKAAGLPVVISFTVETDGRLPTGDSLGEAIGKVDELTGGYPAYYMVNCAHPDHFRNAISGGEAWIERIGGVRANASRMSHEELDNAEELDDGNPQEFGQLHGEIARLLPNLRVVGGCCGTDDRHVGCVGHELLETA